MTNRRKHRGRLSDEDRALWEKVVEKTDPLRPGLPQFSLTSPLALRPGPAPTPSQPTVQPHKIKPFHLGAKAAHPRSGAKLQPSLDEVMAATSPNMDRRNFDRLKKGKLAVDGKIDLHGLTLAEAHPRLIAFVRDAHAGGKRLLLVITGKGKSTADQGIMPVRRGILRHNVPQWLSMPPLAPLVLQVTQATQKHGGGGAYYVYLRRQR